jgi:2,3-bisphosphoglycerate-dependent phosphoglycerate mutase
VTAVELVLIRHAEPAWVNEGLNVDDPPLTDRGRTQAELLADRLADETLDQIVVSPLRRARQTAAPLLDRLRRPLDVGDWLEEIRNPLWHGTPAEKAAEAFREERARPADRRWEGLDGGESVRDFVTRIRQNGGLFLAEQGIERARDDLPVWRVERPGRRLALVAHAGTNAVLIGLLLGLEPVPWEWERFVLGHGSISRLEAMETGDGHTFSLTRLSDVEHLPEELRTR